MNRDELARLRSEYEAQGLTEHEMAPDPFSQFEEWYAGATNSGLQQPNAFVLATADQNGHPSARALLMKDFSRSGLVFYTGLESEKSRAMSTNPRAAATFVWIPLHRQVRFQGSVSRVEDEVADAYFASRPRGAQIAAHASRQGAVVGSRSQLDQRFEQVVREFGEGVIPRPSHWGGWALSPSRVEFWQGQPNRFHDRVRYQLQGSTWTKERLAP